jgi:hypothetical protein
VEWAESASAKRTNRNVTRNRVEGDWKDFIPDDHEARVESRRKGRVQRSVMKAMLDTSFGGRWHDQEFTISVKVASKTATEKLADKIGSRLAGGASGDLAQPNEDESRYRDKHTRIDLTVPYNWWERVGRQGLAIVENRLVLDARRLKGNKKTGEKVYAVLYVATGDYKQESSYRYEPRPNSCESQNDIRPWRGKVRVTPDGKARFTLKRLELHESEDHTYDLDYLDDDE